MNTRAVDHNMEQQYYFNIEHVLYSCIPIQSYPPPLQIANNHSC